jgi:tetratricopeptide (TPR) repeat protein
LPVIARGALESLGEHERERATALGATYALGGDIRRESGHWLVSVRIDALKSATTLWANSYRDADATAAFLRTRIATEVVDAMRCASADPHVRGWGGTSGVAPDDVDSLRLLMNVCAQMRGNANGDGVRTVLRTLAARYPDSAQISAGLANHLAWSLSSTPVALRAAQLDEAEHAARRAMALDPNLGEPYLAMANVRLARGAPASEIAALFEEGLRRDPEHATLNEGLFLQRTGRNADAEAYTRRGAAHDPLSLAKRVVLADNLAALGRQSEAARILKDAAARWHDSWLWQVRVRHAAFYDIENLDALLAEPPDDASNDDVRCWRDIGAAMANVDADVRRHDGIAALDQCGRNIEGGVNIEAHIALGDLDGAFAEERHIAAWSDPARPVFDVGRSVGPLLTVQARALQRDPRFMPLMLRLGLIAIWQESDRWPDFCQSPDLPYNCRAEAERLGAQR